MSSHPGGTARRSTYHGQQYHEHHMPLLNVGGGRSSGFSMTPGETGAGRLEPAVSLSDLESQREESMAPDSPEAFTIMMRDPSMTGSTTSSASTGGPATSGVFYGSPHPAIERSYDLSEVAGMYPDLPEQRLFETKADFDGSPWNGSQ
jgi:hypothetical protein